MLERFRKPKWQHPDPEIRRRALEELDPGDGEILAVVAREDTAPAVRRQALRRVCDLALLGERAAEDEDASVREQAQRRYRQLLCGAVPEAPPLAERLAYLDGVQAPELLECLAREAVEASLRAAAVARVSRVTVLRDVVLQDADADLRLAVLERIEDEAVLERIAEVSRTSDKRVSHRARERLEAYREARERPQRVYNRRQQIAATVETLGTSGHWERDLERLQEFRREWQALAQEHGDAAGAGPESEALRSRLTAAQERFESTYSDYRAAADVAVSAKEAVIGPLEAALERLDATRPAEVAEDDAPDDATSEEGPDLATLVANANAAWRETPAHPDASLDDALETRFKRVRDTLDGRRRSSARVTLLESLCTDLTAMLAGKGPIDERAAKRLQQRHDRALEQRPEGSPVQPGAGSSPDLERRLAKAHGALRARLRQQSDRRHTLLERLPERLDALDKALEEGGSREARKLHDGIDADLAMLRALGAATDKLEHFQVRLKRLAPRVKVMQAWGEYASDQAREQLCEEMEGLVGSEDAPPSIANQIRDARDRWKALPPGNPANNQTLWNRFNGAAGKAYEPCKAWFAQRGEARKKNLTLRQQVLDELSQVLDAFDASKVDWKTLANQRRELDQRWRRASPVDRKAGRSQEEGYQKVLAALDEHLGRERQRCVEAREALIEAAEALQESTQARGAAEECKRLQRQWQVTVTASRRKEQALWKRFRGACDVVFGKRQQVFEERDAEDKAKLAAYEMLCARLEALLSADLDGLDEARQEAKRVNAEWRAAGAVPRRGGAAVERTFKDLRRRFEEHARGLEGQRRERARAVLVAWSQLCDVAEVAAARGGAGDGVAELEGRWQALPALSDAEAGASLRGRFERALSAMADASARDALCAEHAGNREARETICLRMEILSGVDSPPEFADARMAAQVARLASALGDRHAAAPTDSPATLLQEWYRIGPAAPADAPALQARFDAASKGSR